MVETMISLSDIIYLSLKWLTTSDYSIIAGIRITNVLFNGKGKDKELKEQKLIRCTQLELCTSDII